MSTPNPITGQYPFPSSPDQSKKVKYPAGVDSYNEDYDQSELYRELEDVVRTLAIVKCPGIIAKKTTINTTLFPTPIAGNQFSISPGSGITNNGAIISELTASSITDITAVTGYVDPATITSGGVYLILRKYVQNYANRHHPETGIQFPTRLDILSGNSIIEFLVNPIFDPNSNAITSDRDVVVLGKLTGIGPITFDTSEDIGKRMILRVGEIPFVEVTGAIMKGNFFMQNQYEVFDLPQWGHQYYQQSGAVNNKDFIRLFSRINYQLAVLRDITFGPISGGYGLIFGANAFPKIRLFPNLQPPQVVNLVFNNLSIAIPENNVLYLNLSDSNILIDQGTSGGGGGIGVGQGGDNPVSGGGTTGTITDPPYTIASYLNNFNFGTDPTSDLKRFPICWHYFNGDEATRKLIFADGSILKLNEQITSEGDYSTYLRTVGVEPNNSHGNNYMTGNLQIIRNNATVILGEGTNGITSDETAGIEWRRFSPNTNVVVAEFKRFRPGGTGGEDHPSGLVEGDAYLTLLDGEGIQGNSFIFTRDGRIKIASAAKDPTDALRLNEGFDKRGEDLSSNSITGSVRILKNNPQIILQDSTSNEGFQGIQFEKFDGGEIGYLERESAPGGTGPAVTGSWNSGDLLFATTDNDVGNFKQVKLKVDTGHWQVAKLLVDSDATINGSLSVGLGNNVSGNSASAIGKSNVVSGEGATALGEYNSVSGVNSYAFGSDNEVTENQGISAGGVRNRVTAAFGATLGGYNNTADGQYSVILGRDGIVESEGEVAQSIGNLFDGGGGSIIGGSQVSRYILTRITTNNSSTELTTDGNPPGADNRIKIPANLANYFYTVKAVGKKNNNSDYAIFIESGVVMANATTALFVSNTEDKAVKGGVDGITWACTVVSGTTDSLIKVNVNGSSAATVDWTAFVEIVACAIY